MLCFCIFQYGRAYKWQVGFTLLLFNVEQKKNTPLPIDPCACISVLHVLCVMHLRFCWSFLFTFDFCFLSLVDAAAVDNSARISPENNLDFYAYSQAAPYSVILSVLIGFRFLSPFADHFLNILDSWSLFHRCTDAAADRRWSSSHWHQSWWKGTHCSAGHAICSASTTRLCLFYERWIEVKLFNSWHQLAVTFLLLFRSF